MYDFLRSKENSPESINLSDIPNINSSLSGEEKINNFLDSIDGSIEDLQNFAATLLVQIAREKEILQGLFLLYDGKSALNYLACYAYNKEDIENLTFSLGEGLPGQVAHDRKLINLKNIPKGYIIVQTGLGQASPNSLIIFPIIYNEVLLGVMELASFHDFTATDEAFFLELSKRTGEKIYKFSNIGISKNG